MNLSISSPMLDYFMHELFHLLGGYNFSHTWIFCSFLALSYEIDAALYWYIQVGCYYLC